MKIEQSTHHSVTYKDQEYIRFGNDCWYQYYGSSLEPVMDCSELDKVFWDTVNPIAKESTPIELKTLNRHELAELSNTADLECLVDVTVHELEYDGELSWNESHNDYDCDDDED